MERNLQASKRTGARSFYLSTLPSRLMGTGHLGVGLGVDLCKGGAEGDGLGEEVS